MLVLHGEHELKSRNRLIELVEVAHEKHAQVIWLDGKKLTQAILETSVGSDDLFGNPKLLIIEQVFAGPKSKRKDDLIKAISKIDDPNFELILWETKTLTATQLKSLGNPKVELFKLSNAVFTWIDSLSPAPAAKPKMLKLFNAAVEAESAEFCLLMMLRQIRMMIQAKENQLPPMAPFMIGKLKKQAEAFSLRQLLDWHAALFGIDKRQKTGMSPANVCQELEVLQMKA